MSLEELLRKMIVGLRKQAEEKVPNYGRFPVVYEREEVTDLHIGLSHLILKVSNVRFVGGETERFLELAAVNYPCPYGAETVLGFGTTKEILAILRDEETLLVKLMERVPKLTANIEEEERESRYWRE